MANEYTEDFAGRDGEPGQWHEIVSALRILNSSAKVIVLTVFNPYNSSPSYLYRDDRGLFEAVEPYLARINGTITDAARDGGYAIADAHTAYLAYQPGSLGSVTYMYPPWYQYAFRNPHLKALGQQIITDLHIAAFESMPEPEPPSTLYTLTLNSAGDATGTGSYPADTVVPVSTTVPTGYTFVCWVDQNSIAVSEAAAFDYTMPAADMTLEATFEAIPTYTVTFDSTGGSTVAPQAVYHGGTAERPDDPIKAGYTFTGWFLGEDDKQFDFSTPIYLSITLYAEWQEPTGPAKTTVQGITYSVSGPHLNITIRVSEVGSDSPVFGATITAELLLENSVLTQFTVTTGSSGSTTYRYTRAPAGTYTTKITDILAEDYEWDEISPANSYFKPK